MRKFFGLLFLLVWAVACNDDEAGFVRTSEADARIRGINEGVRNFRNFAAAAAELELSAAVAEESALRLTFSDGSSLLVPQQSDGESFVTLRDEAEAGRCWAVNTASGVALLRDAEGNACRVEDAAFPHFDVDADGFWTVEYSAALTEGHRGGRITDSEGRPVAMRGDEACVLIRSAICSDEGVTVTLADGSTVELPLSNAEDLSRGATANCYVVNRGGDYCFAATVRGNGKAAAGMEPAIAAGEGMKADWLWMDREGLISDVKYSGGRISFTASELKGNAVVALFDGDRVVWSWHIWLTDELREVVYPNGAVFLDRNLGAVGMTAGGTDAYGLYYQWGRKDPFYGGTTTETSAEAFRLARENTVFNPAYAKLEWQMAKDRGATLEEAAAAPATFFNYTGRLAKDWLKQPANDLWGENKTMFDPCPKGYRIPDVADWSDLEKGNRYVSGVSQWDMANYRMICTFAGGETWYPAQGSRNAVNGNLIGLVSTRSGNYWACGNQAGKAEHLFFKKSMSSSSGEINRSLAADRSTGYNVRCVKEK